MNIASLKVKKANTLLSTIERYAAREHSNEFIMQSLDQIFIIIENTNPVKRLQYNKFFKAHVLLFVTHAHSDSVQDLNLLRCSDKTRPSDKLFVESFNLLTISENNQTNKRYLENLKSKL